jgi:uncharacterized protein YjbI with pentapeptide repeats
MTSVSVTTDRINITVNVAFFYIFINNSTRYQSPIYKVSDNFSFEYSENPHPGHDIGQASVPLYIPINNNFTRGQTYYFRIQDAIDEAVLYEEYITIPQYYLTIGNATSIPLPNATQNYGISQEVLDDHTLAPLYQYNGITYKGYDWSGANFSGADLTNVRFGYYDDGPFEININLNAADLSGAILDNTWFSSVQLTNANLSDVSGTNTLFQGRELNNCNFSRAKLNSIQINNGGGELIIDNINFTDAKISTSSDWPFPLYLIFDSGFNLTRTDLTGSYFLNTTFSGADISGMILNNINVLENITFIGYGDELIGLGPINLVPDATVTLPTGYELDASNTIAKVVEGGTGGTGGTIAVTLGNSMPQITDLSSGTSFNFTEPIDGSSNFTNTATVYGGGTGSNLELSVDLSAPGLQIRVVQYPSTYKFIFANYDKSSLDVFSSFDFVFALKVLDASGNIVQNINNNIVKLEVYIDISGNESYATKNKVEFFINGNLGQSGGYFLKKESAIPGKYMFSGSLRRGDGWAGSQGSVVTSSSGSDPHITTLSGIKYDFHPSTRKNYTLYKSKEVNISSHFTGFKSGIFYDKVMIDLPNKEKMEVEFNKKKIKGKSSLISISEQFIPVKYKNTTSDKSFGKNFQPKSLTKLSVQGKNPIDLYIDYQTRYVHFRFPDTIPDMEEISGLIVEPATRLD